MHKLVWETIDNSQEWRDARGGYNDAPPGFREVSAAWLLDSGRTAYAPEYVEFRQILLSGFHGPMLEATLHWLRDGTGWAIRFDHSKSQIRYYLFEVCAHEYEVVEAHMCYRKMKCKKCGHINAVDSSD